MVMEIMHQVHAVVRHTERERRRRGGTCVSFFVCVSQFGVGNWGVTGEEMNWCVTRGIGEDSSKQPHTKIFCCCCSGVKNGYFCLLCMRLFFFLYVVCIV